MTSLIRNNIECGDVIESRCNFRVYLELLSDSPIAEMVLSTSLAGLLSLSLFRPKCDAFFVCVVFQRVYLSGVQPRRRR